LANKRKIINDPVHGFIHLQYELVYDLLEHPWFQRLRRIQQLGLSAFVYPGANHTRFAHALGATHLMQQAIEVLRFKGHFISEEEAESLCAAILLHDIGHGPFSHALEHTLITSVHHEELSLAFMKAINAEWKGRLDTTIAIFEDKYPKKFLHQLVSSQLDMDRLDYLSRDSFFTGVHEGVIGYDRIIKMLEVADDEIVIEEKGIYSLEKFIISRRLMYWQVYLHKTVLSAEMMMVKLLSRAKQAASEGAVVEGSIHLHPFLYDTWKSASWSMEEMLQKFASLDDSDILYSMKTWVSHPDPVLSYLSKSLLQRKLLKIIMQKDTISADLIAEKMAIAAGSFGWTAEELSYILFSDMASNMAYSPQGRIQILFKDKTIRDLVEASDYLNLRSLSNQVVKHYLCFPKYTPTDLR